MSRPVTLACCTLLAVAASARAATADTTSILVETDPSTFVLGGFSGHLRVSPAATPRWTFGLGVYALDLPAFFADLDAADRGEDWRVRVRLGYGLFADRFLGGRDDGLFVGVQLALQHQRAERPGEPGVRFVNALAMPRVGYVWYPFEDGFYLLGWVGVGATGTIAGDRGDYDVLPVVAFGAVHAGWRF